MALRAKTPSAEKERRLKVLLYASPGAGKTHFCCSLPSVYYIDTEGVEDYKHYRDMLRENSSQVVRLNEISDIIDEVKELLTVKHNYKTLVIDSLSFPYFWLSQTEIERLSDKNKNTEGTEFAANTAKPKRLTFKLGVMLSRLDMNIIVVSHEKTEFLDGKEVGKTFDISDKMSHALGATWNLRLQGKHRKLFIKKTRYPEMPTGSLIDFDNGYEVIKKCFGEDMFSREADIESLATEEQVAQFWKLADLLQITEEKVSKWLTEAKALEVEDMNTVHIEKIINAMRKKAEGAIK